MKKIVIIGILLIIIVATAFSGNNATKPLVVMGASSVNKPSVSSVTKIQCNLGGTIHKLTLNQCNAVGKIMSTNADIYAPIVDKIIRSLNAQITSNTDSENDTARQYLNNLNVLKAERGSDPNVNYNITIQELTLGNEFLYSYRLAENRQNQLDAQLNWYKNYGYGLLYGNGGGNGACSGHDGVNPAAGSGDIGQVICNDGWTGSSIYYYNDIENIDYIISKLNTK